MVDYEQTTNTYTYRREGADKIVLTSTYDGVSHEETLWMNGYGWFILGESPRRHAYPTLDKAVDAAIQRCYGRLKLKLKARADIENWIADGAEGIPAESTD